ncbi:MAG TPA: c-type cytochrome [Acidimicrobiales bacterium]|nr:c-type cytochrome [Acidimicrobiales bacterium]
MIVIAAALGTFVIGRDHVPASSSLMQNPGMKLTASMSLTSKGELEIGKTLYVQTCSACHGGFGQGGKLGPSLRGVGSAAVDLWLTAGWMPLRTPESQPEGKPVYLTPSQIDALVVYVYSLDPTGYQVPTNIDLKNASTAQGFQVFSLNCAPCHTITGAGDALANGAHAPPLHGVTETMVLEAIRTGPGNMPRFAPGDITNQEALDVVAFVTKNIEQPANIGGIGLGGVGPVAEGFVGLFVGVGVCLLAAYWVGDRTAREDDEHAHDDVHELDGGDADAGDHDPAADGPDAGDAGDELATTDGATEAADD